MSALFQTTIKQLGHFSDADMQEIEALAVKHTFAKNDILLTAGTMCESWFFILEGELYQYEEDSSLQKAIIDLHTSGDWVLNGQSFTQRKPSSSFIAAFTDSLVYEFKIESLHKLVDISPAMLQLGKVLGEASSRLELFDKKLSPQEKYTYFLNVRPVIFQVYPLHMIASFLKMTPETLSRIRGRKLS